MRLPQDTIDAIVTEYRAGTLDPAKRVTVYDLAHKYGTTGRTVSRHVQAAGVTLYRRGEAPTSRKAPLWRCRAAATAYIDLNNAGVRATMEYIAKRFKVSIATVSNWAKKIRRERARS